MPELFHPLDDRSIRPNSPCLCHPRLRHFQVFGLLVVARQQVSQTRKPVGFHAFHVGAKTNVRRGKKESKLPDLVVDADPPVISPINDLRLALHLHFDPPSAIGQGNHTSERIVVLGPSRVHSENYNILKREMQKLIRASCLFGQLTSSGLHSKTHSSFQAPQITAGLGTNQTELSWDFIFAAFRDRTSHYFPTL